MPRRAARSPTRTEAGASFDCFAVAAPGLEPLVAIELTRLGIPNRELEGGCSFVGSLETLARANLWLRTASRIVVRVAAFRAQAFHELERLARAVPWDRFVAPGAALRFRVTSRKSKLYHTDAIAQRFMEAVAHRLGRAPQAPDSAPGEDAGDADAQLFVVRVERDQFVLSADSSGALLHQRGYRQAVAKAPLRETLGAALVLASGWTESTPLLDPMCGSGTIPIEAALLARRIAPGLRRRFMFRNWPEFQASTWRRLHADAEGAVLPTAPAPIRGSDRDGGAIEAARANSVRAGVADDVEWSVRSISAIEPCTSEHGLVATNPPYGVRVGEAAKLRDLYARLGTVVRERCSGWDIALLSANPRLDAQLGVTFIERLSTRNGGIPVRLLVGSAGVATVNNIQA